MQYFWNTCGEDFFIRDVRFSKYLTASFIVEMRGRRLREKIKYENIDKMERNHCRKDDANYLECFWCDFIH